MASRLLANGSLMINHRIGNPCKTFFIHSISLRHVRMQTNQQHHLFLPPEHRQWQLGEFGTHRYIKDQDAKWKMVVFYILCSWISLEGSSPASWDNADLSYRALIDMESCHSYTLTITFLFSLTFGNTTQQDIGSDEI